MPLLKIRHPVRAFAIGNERLPFSDTRGRLHDEYNDDEVILPLVVTGIVLRRAPCTFILSFRHVSTFSLEVKDSRRRPSR